MVNDLMSDDPESLEDINGPILSKAAVDAHEWFNEECDVPVDIFDIINRCLKVVKKIHTPRAFKAFTQLTAVMQYVKLRDRYRKIHPAQSHA